MSAKDYGLSKNTLETFKEIIENRKKTIILSKIVNSEIIISKGFVLEDYGKDKNLEQLLEIHVPCVVKIEITSSKVTMKIFARSDTKRKNNLIGGWRVKYFCNDFTAREDRDIEFQHSIVKILIGPDYTSHDEGLKAQLDESHFAAQKSVIFLKCFSNEWAEINRKINEMFKYLPLAKETLQHEDSGNSSSSPGN